MADYDFSVIRSIRKNKNLTLVKLAEKSRLTFPTVASIENNKSVPSLSSLDQIAQALDLNGIGLLTLCRRRKNLRAKSENLDHQVVLLQQNRLEICRLATLGELKFHRFKAGKGTQTDVHYEHADVLELSYVLSGVIELKVKGEPFILHADETFIFDGTLDHHYTFLTEGEFLTIHIPRDPSSLEKLLT